MSASGTKPWRAGLARGIGGVAKRSGEASLANLERPEPSGPSHSPEDMRGRSPPAGQIRNDAGS